MCSSQPPRRVATARWGELRHRGLNSTQKWVGLVAEPLTAVIVVAARRAPGLQQDLHHVVDGEHRGAYPRPLRLNISRQEQTLHR
eukprot:COSAG01_NODE_2089_length_8454_cov_12.054339_2_plen_85_part_00